MSKKPPILIRGTLNTKFLDTLRSDERSIALSHFAELLKRKEKEARLAAKSSSRGKGFDLLDDESEIVEKPAKKRRRPLTVVKAVDRQLIRRKKLRMDKG